MLVYRQKKLNSTLNDEQAPQIPDYWKPAVKAINELNQQQRTFYSEQENQMDMIVQDEALFRIDPSSQFVSYVEDSKIDE